MTLNRLALLGLLGISILSAPALPAPARKQAPDEFLLELYDKLHLSPMQEKFRQIAPMPVGCVYIQRPGEGEKEIREHFRKMKELGFTTLQGIMSVPGWTREQIMLIALDEGIIPWWYGQGGWEQITDELLKKLAVPRDGTVEEIRAHPKMVEYQTNLFRDRVKAIIAQRDSGMPVPDSAGVTDTGDVGPYLSEQDKTLFKQWVKDTYKIVENLNFVWNRQHSGLGSPFKSWEDFQRNWTDFNPKEYRNLRDIFRFKADMKIYEIREMLEEYTTLEKNVPIRTGGEMGMLHPFAYRGVDMEGIAEVVTDYGSFSPSIHLSWHFGEVDYEIVRPVYMQAALAQDYFKGGWSVAWESTGGPQQFSGGTGFTVDDGVMTQLMLSYLAAGYRGFGFWCWSARAAGSEAGEYSLLDRHNKVTDRAIKVGQIGRAARKYRDELWKARKEPLVGVYVDFDNEAIWAAMSVDGWENFQQEPINARLGVSRALINANIPYEYVTASDLRNGLAGRYRIIYLPFVISIHKDVMEILSDYVRQGGRLVMDMPSAYYDECCALMSTDKGTTFERTFGAVINEYQYAGVNVPCRINDLQLLKFVIDITPTHAEVLATYDNGKPAITEAKYGQGTAVILGYEASMMCFMPGDEKAETMLLTFTMGDYELPYACRDAIVYRLAGTQADHYFFINDGAEKTVTLETGDYVYSGAIDAVTGEKLQLNAPIRLQRYDGRWLRYEK